MKASTCIVVGHHGGPPGVSRTSGDFQNVKYIERLVRMVFAYGPARDRRRNLS